MRFYDFELGGFLTYNEFMEFILPCDNKRLRSETCQRKTYELQVRDGKKRLYHIIESLLADFFEAEINCHT